MVVGPIDESLGARLGLTCGTDGIDITTTAILSWSRYGDRRRRGGKISPPGNMLQDQAVAKWACH